MYEYATGLIRVLEKEIADHNDLNRMIDAPNAEAAFDVLNDSDLKDNILNIKPENFEDAINADDIQLKEFIEKFTEKNSALYKLIFLEEDFFNIKLAFKEKISKIKFTNEDYSKLNTTGKSDSREILKDTDPYIAKSIKNIKKALRKKNAKQIIDAVVDKEYFKCAINLSRKINSGILIDFFRLSLDITNIKSALRAKKMSLPMEELKRQLIASGNLKIKNIIDNINGEEKDFIYLLKSRMEFSGHWNNIIDSYYKNHNLIEIENGLDAFLTAFLKNEINKLSSGPEIVFYYAYLKRLINSNIRLILTGKINNIPKEEIKARIRQ